MLCRVVALFVCLPFASTLVAEPSSKLKGSARPNFIVLLADDLGYGELSCQGNPQIPTPHIDSIATQGVRLTDGYVTASYCSPSRAGLMTGRFQPRFGYDMNPTGSLNLMDETGLPLSQTTFVQTLADAGYQTSLVGKWHLGATAAKLPQKRGFQNFFGFLHEGHYFVPKPYDGVTTFLRKKELPEAAKDGRYREGDVYYSDHLNRNEPLYDADNPIMRGNKVVEERSYLTDAFTREAVAFLETAATNDAPFFLYLSYNAVHSPLQGAEKYMQRFAAIEDVHRRIFAAMLGNLDDSVGEVLATLKRLQIEDNTMIVFLSDNGGPTKELTSSNAPLREGKGSVYEGGLRIPFLWKWKGKLPEGTTYRRPVCSTDIAATILASAGLDASQATDGVNVLPYLNRKHTGDPHDMLYWRMNDKTALRKGDWKIVRPRKGKPFELYQLNVDMGEQNNLAGREPKVFQDMVRAWMAMDKQMADPLPRPRISKPSSKRVK